MFCLVYIVIYLLRKVDLILFLFYFPIFSILRLLSRDIEIKLF